MTYQELYDMAKSAGCEDWPVFFRSRYAGDYSEIEEGVNLEPYGNQMVIEG